MGTSNVFRPLECISESNSYRIGTIILNKEGGTGGQQLFHELWKKSVFRACADGGTNFVYDLIKKSSNGITSMHPDLVSGDFDSIRPEVKKFYEEREGTSVVPTPDQDETDFTKSLLLIAEKIGSGQTDVNLLVALAGRLTRFDHAMACISTLWKAWKIFKPNVRVCVMYDESFICLLPEGETTLKVDTGFEGKWCGLIPVGAPAVVTTTGLKWNLNNDKMEFGELVSTSNELDGSEEVSVRTDVPLVWTMAFKMNR